MAQVTTLGRSKQLPTDHRVRRPVIQLVVERNVSPRLGVATLELVLCMPVLLVLMVGIVWLGYSVIGQSEVAVEARHKAWQQRFDDTSSKPLHFLDDSYATEETTHVSVSPLLDDAEGPESSHDIATNPWSHHAVDLNRTPNWALYLTAAINAKTGGLQVAYSDARVTLGKLQQLAAQQVVEEMKNVIREFLDNPLSGFESNADEAKQENEAETERQKKDVERQIDQTQIEIQQTEQKIQQLRRDKRNAEEADQKESLQARIDMNENKIKRLKSKLKRLRDARKAMD